MAEGSPHAADSTKAADPVRTLRPAAARARIGVARRDITPPLGIYARQWGAASHDVAEGVHRPLSLTAMTFEPIEGGDPLVLVSMDAVSFFGGPGGIDAGDEFFIRGALNERLGYGRDDAGRVMISLTHSHAACSISSNNASKPGGDKIAPYLSLIRNRLLDAVEEARHRAAPATLTFAAGRCDMAGQRDLPDPFAPSDAPRYLCGWNPDALADDALLVGRAVRDEDGATLATLVNYACHPTTLAWENRLISPDFIGGMREIVEPATGHAPCLYLQGASGDLAPREQYVGDPAVADRHGAQLGYAALSALAGMDPPGEALALTGLMESGAPLGLWRRRAVEVSTRLECLRFTCELPLREMPTLDSLRQAWEQTDDRTLKERIKRRMSVVETVGSSPTVSMPAWAWRLGDVLLIGQPNEAYQDYQIELRRSFPSHAVVVMNLVNTCGGVGYVAPADRYDLAPLYQVWQSPYERGAYDALLGASREALGRLASA